MKTEDGPRAFTGPVKFLQYIKGPDHWHNVGDTGEPAFENSWVNFGGAEQVARFIRDAAGVVHIEGLVKDGTIGANAVFTLPVGYRPNVGLNIVIASNEAYGRLRINTNGEAHAVAGNNTWFSLHCSFYVG